MAYKLGNRVKMTVSGTPGTGTITLGSAVSGFATFGSALSSGDTCPYVIEDTSDSWEIGVGTYTASGTTLARTTVVASSAGGTTKISATSSAVVYLAPLATDLNAGTYSGILKADGAGVFSAATAGTDYLAPPSGTAILKANSGGALANASAGTDYVAPGGALGTPSSGTLSNCTSLPISTGVSGLGTGVATFLATPSSSNLASAVTDETGSGSLVFATSPSLTTPTLGAASATSINKVAITAPATGSTLTIADNKTLTASNTLTLAGTDSTTMTFPATSSNVLTTGNTATITKGYTVTPSTPSLSSNSFTVDPTAGNYQYVTQSSTTTTMTITAPSSDCAVDILLSVPSTATASPLTAFSGFTVGSSVGATISKPASGTNYYLISVRRLNNGSTNTSTYSIYALQ